MADLARLSPELSGPVMEALLVAGAPMAIIPTQAAFGGSVWDAKRRLLTLRLNSPQPGLELHVLWHQRPVFVQGAAMFGYSFKANRLYLRLPKGPTKVRVKY